MRKLKLFFACLLMAVFSIGQMWGTNFTLSSASQVSQDGITVSFGSGTNTSNSPTWYSAGLRLYANNTITITCNNNITGVIFNWEKQGNKAFASATASPGSYTHPSAAGNGTWEGEAKSITFTLGSSGQLQLNTFSVSVTTGGTPTCAAPTFDPEHGETFEESIDVEISAEDGATIYYTTDGNDPTTSSSVYTTALQFTETTTLKAMAVKAGSNNSAVATATYTKIVAIHGYAIDFENDLDAYVDWTFSNIGVRNSITTHGGSYYASNVNSNGNGVGSASITTNAKVATPGVLTFYVSKESGNNKTSAWTVYVSEDYSDWTEVESFTDWLSDNAGGTWHKETVDLSDYTNVYVSIDYSGSTAIRAIDDIELAEASAVAKPTISGKEQFISSTTVTLNQDDADAIYYTTNGDVPTTSLTPYSEPFVLTASATVKAIAVKGTETSNVAEKEFTKVSALTNMADVQAEAGNSEKSINVVISNWVVTGVSGSQVWIADAANEKGILLYKSGHGFEANKKLNGEVVGTKIKLYNLYPELTSLVSTDVTVSNADDITPRGTTIAALTSAHPAEQGTVVKLENVTYTSSALSDGVNSIAADNKLYSSLALVDGTEYDITGVVTYYKDGNNAVVKIAPRSADDVYAHSAVVIPTAANLAALKAAARGTYILTLNNAVVSYVNGKNAFIEDETGGALIFFQDHGFTAGDCLNGKYQVTTTDYQGKFEITAIEPQTGAAKTTAEIPLTTLTITQLNANFSSYESRRVKIVGANVTDAISGSDRNGAINDGAALAVYAGVASTITLTANDNVDIIGYPGFHNTDQQLTVWAQADIKVNEKEDPELAYDPELINLTLDNLAAFVPAELKYAQGFDDVAAITYESSNPSIATVDETTGVVEVVATAEGSATITATYEGNGTYKADDASYTINVGAVPVYTMTFDMTKVSYDDAAASQVVWNSNVVTMTADKNEGTAVNNYLPGGYTSGQTIVPITESRFYTHNSISFVPKTGITITKVEWLATQKSYATALAGSNFNNAEAAVDGTNDKLVVITPSAAEFSVTLSGQVRTSSIAVYYQAESEKDKLPASIAIDGFEMTVNDEDFLLSAIEATSNPNKKAISYAITSGEAVSIVGENANRAFHALSEGDATITATILDDLGNYTGASTTFTIHVNPYVAPSYEIVATPDEWTFATVEKDVAVDDKEIAIALTNVDASKVTLTKDGAGKDAFSVTNNIASTGKIIVSASSDVVGTFNATLTLSDEDGNAADEVITLSIKVNAPVVVDDLTGTWQLVTDASQLVAGKKVIIASVPDEGAAVTMSTTQATNNRIGLAGATVSEGVITAQNGTAVFTIEAGTEDNTIAFKSSADQYLYAASSGSNYIRSQGTNDANGSWIVTIDEGIATIVAQGEYTHNVMRYNPNNNSPIFACYGSNSTTGTLITLYMLHEDTPEPQPEVIRDGLEAGKWGTLCPTQNISEVEGAEFFQISYLEELGGVPYNMVFDAISGTTLEAGKPYFFIANAGEIRGIKTGTVLDEADQAGVNGFYGYIGAVPMNLTWRANYDGNENNTFVIYNNSVFRITGDTQLKSERCYININSTEPSRSVSQPAPGRRRINMAVSGTQVATGIDAINASEKPVKMMIDGQLFIIRGEKMYDATGRLVK